MPPSVPFQYARTLAQALKIEMGSKGIEKISPRPWNFHDSDHTLWWIVPASEWPAYRFGKFFFSPDLRHAPGGQFLCGIHIEKGLDPSLKELYPSKAGRRHIMGKDWAWFHFMDDPAFSKLRSAIGRISKNIGTPVIIQIEAGIVEDPASFDPRASRPKWDVSAFESSGESLISVKAETPSNLLTSLSKCQNYEELARQIALVSNMVWVDVFIGSLFSRAYPGEQSELWDATKLWTKALSIWIPWFR